MLVVYRIFYLFLQTPIQSSGKIHPYARYGLLSYLSLAIAFSWKAFMYRPSHHILRLARRLLFSPKVSTTTFILLFLFFFYHSLVPACVFCDTFAFWFPS